MLLILAACAILAAAPDEIPPPPDETPAPVAKPAPPKKTTPPPDRDDAFDAAVPKTLAPSPDAPVVSIEADAPTLLGHAVMAGFPVAACFGVPAAFVALVAGGIGVLFAAAAPPVFAVAAAAPCIASCFSAPACLLWPAAGGVVAWVVSALAGSRRGTLVASVGGAFAGGVAAAILLAIPPILVGGSLALGAVIGGAPLVQRFIAGEALNGQQTGLMAAFVIALVFHPLLSAGWLLLGGLAAATSAGAASAFAWRASGRRKEGDEGFFPDVIDVGPPPVPPSPTQPAVPEAPARRQRAP